MVLPAERHFINIHSHRKPQGNEEWVLRNAFAVLPPLQLQHIPYAVSIGIHPWKVGKHELENVRSCLAMPNVLALGEVGLDRANGPELSLQMKILEAQLQLNQEFAKPVLLHVVKAYSDIMPFLKKYPFHYIFHHYRGNEQQNQQLLKHQNVWFSFGKDLMEDQVKVKAVFEDLPLDRIFLETDTSSYQIADIYLKAAQLKMVDLEVLKKKIFENFRAIFEQKI